MDERFKLAKLRADRRVMDERFSPEWTAQARCRPDELGGVVSQRLGMPWPDAFTDDLATQPHPDLYRWPPRLLEVLETCAGCPVRRECLELAFELEGKPVLLEPNVAHYSTHHEDCSDPRCSGCVPLEERVSRRDMIIEVIPSGVYGGAPGRVRQHFMDLPCPDHTEGRCQTCDSTGRVLNPDRIEQTAAWADAFMERMGWGEPLMAEEVAG